MQRSLINAKTEQNIKPAKSEVHHCSLRDHTWSAINSFQQESDARDAFHLQSYGRAHLSKFGGFLKEHWSSFGWRGTRAIFYVFETVTRPLQCKPGLTRQKGTGINKQVLPGLVNPLYYCLLASTFPEGH